MRAISLFFTSLLLLVWIAIARYAYVCMILKKCDPVEEGARTVRAKTLSIKYNNTVILDGYEEFGFDNGQISPNINDDNIRLLDDLALYLINNPERRIEIYGRYRNSEGAIKSGFFENIGLARADAIRKELVRRGGNEERISLNHEEIAGEELGRPVSFSLLDSEKRPEEYTRVMYTFNNMTFSDANFAVDSDVFHPGQQFLLYADSVKTFLANHANYKVTIIGHTDDDGNDLYNETLGLKRANSAAAYLHEIGITNPIIARSQGETKPMAPNTTEKNKQKNRRVNFVLKP